MFHAAHRFYPVLLPATERVAHVTILPRLSERLLKPGFPGETPTEMERNLPIGNDFICIIFLEM